MALCLIIVVMCYILWQVAKAAFPAGGLSLVRKVAKETFVPDADGQYRVHGEVPGSPTAAQVVVPGRVRTGKGALVGTCLAGCALKPDATLQYECLHPDPTNEPSGPTRAMTRCITNDQCDGCSDLWAWTPMGSSSYNPLYSQL